MMNTCCTGFLMVHATHPRGELRSDLGRSTTSFFCTRGDHEPERNQYPERVAVRARGFLSALAGHSGRFDPRQSRHDSNPPCVSSSPVPSRISVRGERAKASPIHAKSPWPILENYEAISSPYGRCTSDTLPPNILWSLRYPRVGHEISSHRTKHTRGPSIWAALTPRELAT